MPKTIKLTPMKVRKPDGSFKDIDAIGGAVDGAESVINDTNRDSTTKYPSVKAAADYADSVVDDIPYRSSVDYENPVTVLDTVTLPLHPEYNTPGDETSGIKYYVNDDQSILGGITLEYGKEYHVIFNGDAYKCYTYPYYTGAITPDGAWSTGRSFYIGSPKFYGDRHTQYSHPFTFAKIYDYDTSGSSVTYTSRNAFMVYPIAENQVDITAASVSIVKYDIDAKNVDPALMNDHNGTPFNPITMNDGVLEPYAASASVRASHAEGAGSSATAAAAHAEGIFTSSRGYGSHAEGTFTTASASESHAEGLSTIASGTASHAEGIGSRATASYSHASGWYSYARGYASTATGGNTTALGRYSFTSGLYSAANSDATAAIGCGTRADSTYQFASGKYNKSDLFSKYAHIIGNGTDNYTRSNAYTLDWEGNGWFAGDVYVHSNSGTDQDAGSKRLVTEDELEDKIRDIKLFKFPNATIHGAPSFESGQVSGFSNTNYLTFPFILDVRNLPFSVDFCFTTGSDVTIQQNILDSAFGLALAIRNGRGLMALSSNGQTFDLGQAVGTYPIAANSTYYARLSWDGSVYRTALSVDGVNYTDDMSIISAAGLYPTTIYIGGSPDLFGAGTAHPFKGSINLNKSVMSINGQVFWQGMDDAGLSTRASVSLDNLDAKGEERFKTDTTLSVAGMAADAAVVGQRVSEIEEDISSLDEYVLYDEYSKGIAGKEPLHKVLPATLVTGQTQIVFTDDAISDDSMIYVYTTKWGVNPSDVVQDGNTVTLTFDAQSADIGVMLEVR